jgi:hypothetical protein
MDSTVRVTQYAYRHKSNLSLNVDLNVVERHKNTK